MARQMLTEGPYLDPPIAAPLSADTATGAVLMWNPLQFTKFYGDEARPGRIYQVKAGGSITCAATGALTISPSITTTNAAGTTLGASFAQTVPASKPAGPWWIDACFVVRTIGAPGGSNATMMGEGTFLSGGLAATASTNLTCVFGGASAGFDQGVGNAIAFTKTLTVAGSFTTDWVFGRWVN